MANTIKPCSLKNDPTFSNYQSSKVFPLVGVSSAINGLESILREFITLSS